MPERPSEVDVDVDVLIVGGGGAGLTASILLSELGIDHVLINARPSTSNLPKAHLLNQHTMEIFTDLGVADTVYERGTPAENMRYSGWYAGLAGTDPDAGRRFGLIESWGAAGSSPEWAAASPYRSTNLPQIRLEPVLRERAEALAPPGRIRFHHELTTFTQDADGVTATIADHATGTGTGAAYEIRARYLLGCDGGRTVGRALGIDLEGPRDLMRVATIHLTADLSAWARDPEVYIRWLLIPDTGTGATVVPMGPTRWGPDSEEWVVHLNYATDDPRGLDDDKVTADLRTTLGLYDHDLTVHLITRWAIEGVVASRFQDGRVFLLGDAAHRHPPTGGLGLNAAIQDTANLAWKLAAVLRGEAGAALLDTYEPERRPTTARNVQRAIDNALNHIVTADAIAAGDTTDPAGNWANMRRLWSGLPEDAEHAAHVRRLIAGQSMEFNEHNIEYGYTYASSAIVPDGTAAPDNPDPIRIYQPCARPGHPLPHAWLDADDGTQLSTLDLVRPGRLLLIAGEDGEDWCEAAVKLADTAPLDVVRIGHLDGEYLDRRSTWFRLRGHDGGGAVLVRPDRFVAWRALTTSADPVRDLSAALDAVLARR
ncbi:FAD-dependent monooxygenase [Actinomadura barringtoniae]|uniref:FAD-dependent monooxygenase n=1 Tax=Actinomadura barringtoniae TaxID=1427535 RepID=A0A939PLX1_9ACTN|nr:FAD-dependent monooxygenase [Actinomadura barringtoniae]MBO2455216.1 FAD-dependent monooxygenase [Actinomadura barringtoniae]